MGTFRKSLKRGDTSRQIEENLKKLNKDLKRTESVLPNESAETEGKKFDWRKEFFPAESDRVTDVKHALAEEVKELRDVVEAKKEIRNLQRVDKHLAGANADFYRLRDELVEQINTDFNLREIESKLDEILGVYGKLHQRIDEGLLNEPPESQQSGDPLAPLGQKFVTFEQLRNHYSLFINRISKQLSTLGGGGEVNFRYLDDVDWDGASDDGKFLKYNHNTERFEFATVSGGGGGGSIAGIDTTGTSFFNNINAAGVVTATAYYGDGSNLTGIAGTTAYADVAGIATYATTAGIATLATNATSANAAGQANGALTLSSNASVNTSGIITAANFYGYGS